jgi:hypothetical protein
VATLGSVVHQRDREYVDRMIESSKGTSSGKRLGCRAIFAIARGAAANPRHRNLAGVAIAYFVVCAAQVPEMLLCADGVCAVQPH